MRPSPAPVRSRTRGACTGTGPRPVRITRSGRCPWRTSRWRPSSVCLSAWPARKAATSASTACANRARAPSRRTSVSGSENAAGWISLTTLSWVTACHSFGGEVEASNTPTIRRLNPLRRHQLPRIPLAQQDAYGDDGFAGVAKALRALQGGSTGPILRLNYQRNSVDVAEAVAQLRAHESVQQPAPNAKTKASPKQTSTGARPGTDAKGTANSPIKAVVMIPAYRTAAKFIELTRPLYPNMIYTSVSFVGSTALKDELKLLGPTFMDGVIVTQVVPAVEGHSKIVLDYKAALAKYFPGEAPDY